jgi:hypothetical protein
LPTQDVRDTAVVGVFPRIDSTGAWAEFIDSDLLGAAANRLGNYVLIPKQRAAGIPVDPRDRIEWLTSADLLGEMRSSWSSDTIAERQVAWAEQAPTIWTRRV